MPPASPKRTSRVPPLPGQKSKNAQAVARFRDRRKIQLEQLTAENAELRAQIEHLQLDLHRARECVPGSTAPARLAQVEVDNYLVRRENAHLRSLVEHCLLAHQGDLAQLEAAHIALAPNPMPVPPTVVSVPHPHPQPHPGRPQSQPQPQPLQTQPQALPPSLAADAAQAPPPTGVNMAQHAHTPSIPISQPPARSTSAFTEIDLASMHSVSSCELGLGALGDGTPLSPGAMSQRSMSAVPTPPASAALPYYPMGPAPDFSLGPQAGQGTQVHVPHSPSDSLVLADTFSRPPTRETAPHSAPANFLPPAGWGTLLDPHKDNWLPLKPHDVLAPPMPGFATFAQA